MTRPDPATASIAELFAALFDRLDSIESRLRGDDGQLLAPAAAARALGLGRNYFISRPWRIPNHGAGLGRYTLAEYRDWLDRPEAVRRDEWEATPAERRRNLRGAA
jgi:hypothetical protein